MSGSGPDAVEVTLRPFGRNDFGRLISWVPDEAAHAEWCAAFFRFPLDEAQLEDYVESANQPNGRVIFAATTNADDVVGHVEISHIWPHLSSRLSRVLIAPSFRRRGFGTTVVAQALSYSFSEHHASRVDLGVSESNRAAIECYGKIGFRHVGTWPDAMAVGAQSIDVHWMTIAKDDWLNSAWHLR